MYPERPGDRALHGQRGTGLQQGQRSGHRVYRTPIPGQRAPRHQRTVLQPDVEGAGPMS